MTARMMPSAISPLAWPLIILVMLLLSEEFDAAAVAEGRGVVEISKVVNPNTGPARVPRIGVEEMELVVWVNDSGDTLVLSALIGDVGEES